MNRGTAAFLALMVTGVGGWSRAGGPIVAVFDMEDQGSGLRAEVLQKLTTYLSVLLVEGGYQVIPQEQIRDRIRMQRAESYKQCYDQSCQVELGRELSAQKSLSSKIIKIGRTCRLTATLLDLGRAAAEKAASTGAECDEDALGRALEEIAGRLTLKDVDRDGSAEEARKRAEAIRAEEARRADLASIEEERAVAEMSRVETREAPGVQESPGEGAVSIERTAAPGPYKEWVHITFWSGLGLAAFGSVSAYMAWKTGQDANMELNNSLRDRSILWEGSMWAALSVGGALMATGIVLWSKSLEEVTVGLSGISLTPGPEDGCSVLVFGRF